MRCTKAISLKEKLRSSKAGLKLFGHHFPGMGLDHHPVAPPQAALWRHHDAVAVAIDRQHGIAGDLERIAMRIADLGKGNIFPARACGKPGIVEKAGIARLGQADQGHHARLESTMRRVAHQGDKVVQGRAGGRQHLGQAFCRGPAQLSIGGAALALVKSGGIQAGKPGQAGGRHAIPGGEGVYGAPDLRMGQHLGIKPDFTVIFL